MKDGSTHSFYDEWVYNRAAIDASWIVLFRAISPEEDARVIRYYKGRRFWLAEVESSTVRVRRLSLPGSQPSPEGSSGGPEEWVLTIEPRARIWAPF